MTTLQNPSQIVSSENWAHDNTAGRELAAAWIAQARSENSPLAISAVLRDLATSGRWGGVEAGFAFALAVALN